MAENDDITGAFQSMQNKTEIGEVLKELFNDEKISMITDINSDEIKLMTKIEVVAEMKGFSEWLEVTQKVKTLNISKNRQSRKEIIDAVRSLGGVQQRTGGSPLNPMNWFRR